jgi:hypothetical protein
MYMQCVLLWQGLCHPLFEEYQAKFIPIGDYGRNWPKLIVPWAYSRPRSVAENMQAENAFAGESNKRERIREHVPVLKSHTTSACGVRTNKNQHGWKEEHFSAPSGTLKYRVSNTPVRPCFHGYHSRPFERNVFAHSRSVPERWWIHHLYYISKSFEPHTWFTPLSVISFIYRYHFRQDNCGYSEG